MLRGHCREVGTDFESITRSTSMTMLCAPTEAEAMERLDEIEGRMRPLVDEKRLERHLREARRRSGPPDKIVEQIRPYADLGMGYLIVRFPDMAIDTSGIELFGREVIGAL